MDRHPALAIVIYVYLFTGAMLCVGGLIWVIFT